MTKRDDRTATIAWGGDVNLGRRFHYCFHERNARDSLAGISQLGEADLGIVNLECVIATSGTLGIDKNERASYYFRARPEMVEALVKGGVDIVATANNHSGDYGSVALQEQAEWLSGAGISHAGSGNSVREAFRPVFRNTNDLTVAVFSIDSTQPEFAADENSFGHAYIPLAEADRWRQTLEPLIKEARLRADVVLVTVHWGPNNQHVPGRAQISVGHAIIDAGADAVLGSSAHVLQGIEVYHDRPIIHDAGDLLFDALRRDDKATGVFTLKVSSSGVKEVKFFPYEVGFCETIPLQGDSAVAAVKHYAVKCEQLRTAMDVSAEGVGVVRLNPPAREAGPKPSVAPNLSNPVSFELAEPRDEWVVESVPTDAELVTPLEIGPLELLGVRLSPNPLKTRGLIFVDSYWRASEKIDEDWRLSFRAQGEPSSKLGSWGQSSDHDPCDWMWPTSKWTPGVIYRDQYTLRPPAIRHWLDATLKLSVELVAGSQKTGRHPLPTTVDFALSREEAFALLRSHPPRYTLPDASALLPTPEVLWTADQIEAITGGRWLKKPPAHWYVRSISHKSNMIFHETMPGPRMYIATNKRLVAKHELYSDTTGREWDSHSKLLELQDKVEGGVVTRPLKSISPSLPLLQLDDPLHGLMQLGAAGRARLKGKVVAITGSAGKTSLTSMLTHVMSEHRAVQSNAATNYNSRVGLLHLLANTLERTDLVVMEAAVSAINAPAFQNIKIVKPDIAIITNIAPSHLPKGKDLQYIAARKANIFEGVAAGGWAVINRDTACFDYLAKRAGQRGLNILTYGVSDLADINLSSYEEGTGTVVASLPDGATIAYPLAAGGLHMALNSLACLAVFQILGENVRHLVRRFNTFQAAKGRGQIIRTTFEDRALTLIDESYNANPLSMQMAMSHFDGNRILGRKVLILGDMLELGDDAERYHRELASQVASVKPDCVLACGQLMRLMWEDLAKQASQQIPGAWYPNAREIQTDIVNWLQEGDTVLVKGSNSVGLGKLVDQLAP